MRHFINKPIKNYEGLRKICKKEDGMGSYATSLFSNFGDKFDNEENNNDNVESVQAEHVRNEDGDANSTPPIVSSPTTSST